MLSLLQAEEDESSTEDISSEEDSDYRCNSNASSTSEAGRENSSCESTIPVEGNAGTTSLVMFVWQKTITLNLICIPSLLFQLEQLMLVMPPTMKLRRMMGSLVSGL